MQGFNKYYPPDYDPNKHSSLNSYQGKHALGNRAHKLDQGILVVRFELPFNIWCGTCNNHVGMGVRYNAEKKKIGNYYSTPIFSFRCKCHLCDGYFEIETDPKNTRYVVTSGARQKDEDWDPEENGGYAIHDNDPNKPPADPLATLEKTTAAQKDLKEVKAPRIEELQGLSEKLNADPYTLSVKARNRFRQQKRQDAEKKRKLGVIKEKYGLADSLLLEEDDEQARRVAKDAWRRGRAELTSVNRSQRKAQARTSLFSSPSSTGASRLLGAPAPSPASTTLRARLLGPAPRQTSSENVFSALH